MALFAAKYTKTKEADECEHILVDIPDHLEPRVWSEYCIYRVPWKLRNLNKEAYTPQLISIGPFHHGKPKLEDMEKHKSLYLSKFCGRTQRTEIELAAILDQLGEECIRACYAGTFDLTCDFLNMILIDACFIIEFMLRICEHNEDDYIVKTPWLEKVIMNDLILLENQIPFFVLEKLYVAFQEMNVNYSSKKGRPVLDSKTKKHISFIQLTNRFFCHYGRRPDEYIGEKVNHFTDLLRYRYCPPKQIREKLFMPKHKPYNATKLSDTGVKFKPVRDKFLVDIKFEKNKCLTRYPCFSCSWLLKCLPCLINCFPCFDRLQPVLKIPPLEIDDTTERVFRNLMAFEQCHYPLDAYICNYVSLMRFLISSDEDVDLLVEKQVVVNFLANSKAVRKLVTDLGNEIEEVFTAYYWLVQQLNLHCDQHWNHFMATLTRTYFRDFWRRIASLTGLIVLGITITNFIRSFFTHQDS